MTTLTDSRSTPRTPGDLVQEARTAERDGRPEDAAAAYTEALAADPASAAAALGLVRLLDGSGDRARSQQVLRAFSTASRTNANIAAAARQWKNWEASPLPGAVVARIAVTGSGTLTPLDAHLRVACAQAGMHPVIFVGGFRQWAQELLSSESPLYEFGPDVVILSLAVGDLFPRNIGDAQADAGVLAQERSSGLAQIQALLDEAARRLPGTSMIVHSFSAPDRSPFGMMDLKRERGQRARVDAINDGLIELVRERPNVLLFDQERVEARHGKTRIRDERLWYMGSIPFSESFLPVLAAEYVRMIRPLKGLVRKCIVLDLDNTLWGGVIGEDGLDGIKLGGNDAPGNAFYDFQMALDALRQRGILLAICSRNNPEDVWPVIENHPQMVLRRHHFVASRINWLDKATNIDDIARELNIGLDSLVFLDDNPAERALVRQRLPDVLTVDLPVEPAYLTRVLLELDVFESIGLSAEDVRRSEMYLQAQTRREFAQSATAPGDLTSHLESLEMTVTIGPATPYAIPRIAQLVNKTNQFNLTTRRYTEAQVRAMAEAVGQWAIFHVSVADRFGDLGLTGVAIVRIGDDAWFIDSFLLSCRVLGRGIEDALLAHIAAQARAAHAQTLEGAFVRSAKNAPASGFYPTRGFQPFDEAPAGGEEIRYRLDLEAGPALSAPAWLRMSVPAHES
jgi:FkbH-like protein